MNSVRSIYREFTRKDKSKLNILCSATHERYESVLAKTGHNFYGFTATNANGEALQGMKPWNEKYAPLPKNYRMIGNKLPIDVDFDLVLSQNKFGQFQALKPIADQLQIPLVSLEHTLPYPGWPEEALIACKNQRGYKNVFISNYSMGIWGINGSVIEHAVDTDTFFPLGLEREPICVSVVNDFINRNWCCGFDIWEKAIDGLPYKLYGDTPGLSKPATPAELAQAYNTNLIFLNTSTISPIPTVLLEAMSCGMAVVSTATCMIPNVIEDGYNGFISNDVNVLREKIILLLHNPELAKKLGDNAAETIRTRFNIPTFVSKWNSIFEESAVYLNDRI
jgi:glycosyltransferase involved in cell wall biosynthesis